jgi:ribose 5-phosphate isomerase B
MRIAVCSDEPYPYHDALLRALARRKHDAVRYGSLLTGEEVSWVAAAATAARAVAAGECDQGLFMCWTGTGISIAANKIRGIRAALCCDPESARGARIWNHANVLCLSNRLMSAARAVEILDAWLDTPGIDPRGSEGVQALTALEGR